MLFPHFDSPSKITICPHRLATLPLAINETLKYLPSLPILMQNHSGNDSIVLGIVSPWDLHPHLYPSRDNSALKKSNKRLTTPTVRHINCRSGGSCYWHCLDCVVLQPIVNAVGDPFYKITSEALLVTQQLVKVLRPLRKCSWVLGFLSQ